MRKEIYEFMDFDLKELYGILDLVISDNSELNQRYEPGNEEGRFNLFLEKYINKIEEEICVKLDYCNKISDKKINEDLELLITVADMLSGIVIGIPPTLITVILFKRGFNKLCKCE